MRFFSLLFVSLIIPLSIFGTNDSKNDADSINKAISEIAIDITNLYPDYPATPGDVYDAFFLTGTNENKMIRGFVDNNYDIDLSFIGNINVKNLIYPQVQQLIKNKILSAYPNSIINVVIKDLGKFRVKLLGEVLQSEIIQATSITTLSEIIIGKTTNYASLRNIQIKSENGNTSIYDLFLFNINADMIHNPYLKPNDIITIGSYQKEVSISGKIKRPGIYQLLENDTLYNLIYTYGNGFDKLADTTRITLKRKLNNKNKVEEEIKNIIINTKVDDLRNYVLKDFDAIIVPETLTEVTSVIISGQIRKPGTYILAKNDTLYDLIYTYGNGFDKLADTSRIIMRRKLNDKGKVEEETINIVINTERDDLKSYSLRDFDTIEIPEILTETTSVTISGQIKKPGTFILANNDTLYDLIYTYAHGFTKLADTSRIAMRRKLNDKGKVEEEIRNIVINTERDDLKSYSLRDFDTIEIPEILTETTSVTISGQIKKPGTFILANNDTLYDLIYTYAHGFTKLAETSVVEVQRRIGKSEIYSESTIYVDIKEDDIKSFKLHDFDMILVPNKITYSSTILIQGAVSSPATSKSQGTEGLIIGTNISNKIIVSIIEGNRISTVLRKMEGTFNLVSDLENAIILRGNKKIPVNLNKILTLVDDKNNIIMQDKDILMIPFKQLQVFVGGSVNKSGVVPFIENRTAAYYIGISGGFDKKENLFGNYSIRNIYGKKLNKKAIIQPEDSIWVYRDHPMSYIEEYGGWVTTIVATIVISYQLTDLSATLSN